MHIANGWVLTYVVEVHQDHGLGAIILENLLGELVEAFHLVLGLLDDPLKGAQLAGRSALVEKVDVDVLGNRVLAGGDGLEKGRLSAAVLAQQTVAAAQGQLQGGVLDEDLAVEDQAGAGDLDVLALGERCENTGGDAVREAVLVHLVGQTLDLGHLVRAGRGLIFDDGVAKGIELGLLAINGGGAAGSSRVGVGSAGDSLLLGPLGHALLLGRRGSHFGRWGYCRMSWSKKTIRRELARSKMSVDG